MLNNKIITKNSTKVLCNALLMLALAGAMQSAFAQRVQPMVFELSPSGAGASTSLRIENTKSVPLTLEFVASKITLDEQGVESAEPADDDFLIFPPQALVKPGKAQVVRVKYIGNPVLDQSQAYRVSVKQLPVSLKQEGSTGVAMLINFHTLVNIVPKGAKPDLAVTEISPADDGRWSVTVENKGNKFARLSKTEWTVQDQSGSTKPLTLIKSDVGAMTEHNLVLPNAKLTQLVPAIEGFEVAQTSIEIDAD